MKSVWHADKKQLHPFLRLRSEVRAGTVRKYGKKICRNEIAKGIPVDLEWSQEFKSIPPSLVSASIVADGYLHRIYLHRRSKRHSITM